jgi:secondary thiamine-phosphate synthase enzyme
VDSTVIAVDTARRQVVDVTDDVETFCTGHGDGLCSVFVPHATAGVALMETGSGSEADLVDTLERLLPHDDRYRHRHGAQGHGADHLLPVLVSSSLVLPVLGGRPALGTWQRVVVVDINADNPRRELRLSFVADSSAQLA